MPCDKIVGYHDLYWMPYTTAVATLLGATGPDGLQQTTEKIVTPITADALGPETIIDGVYQGGNVSLSFVLQDVKLSIVKEFLNPFTEDTEGTNITGRPEFVGTVGRLACQVAGTLFAAPRTNTPAASLNASGGNIRKFVGICTGPQVEYLDSRPRFIPVTFQVYPVYVSNAWKWWEWVTSVPTT